MTFEGAVVTEQNVTFGIVIVKTSVLNNPQLEATAQTLGIHAFGHIPIVLMEQNHRGAPTYKGRKDLVLLLSNVFLDQIPWQRFTLSAA